MCVCLHVCVCVSVCAHISSSHPNYIEVHPTSHTLLSDIVLAASLLSHKDFFFFAQLQCLDRNMAGAEDDMQENIVDPQED